MSKVAILIENLFEDIELTYPYFRLKEEGYSVDLVGTDANVDYKSKHGYPIKSDLASKDITANSYDAVVIPGGYSPDKMRRSPETVNFVKEMDNKGKVIAAICHGGWMMASCCNLQGKKVTSFFSIKDDLVNAGAEWVDDEVVVDGHLITSRSVPDIVAFTRAIIAKLK